MKDFAFGSDGELTVESGDLQTVTDLDHLAQKLRVHLRTFRGEWWLDTSIGIPYKEEVFVKQPDIGYIDSIFKAAIMSHEADGVLELLSFESDFSDSTREYSFEANVRTSFGELALMNEDV